MLADFLLMSLNIFYFFRSTIEPDSDAIANIKRLMQITRLRRDWTYRE